MATNKELREKKGELYPKLAEVAKRNKGKDPSEWSTEDSQLWDKIYPEYEAAEKELNLNEARQAGIERILNATQDEIDEERRNPHRHNPNPKPGQEDHRNLPNDPVERHVVLEEQRSNAFNAWARRGKDMNRAERKAVAALGVRPGVRAMDWKTPGTKQYTDLRNEFREGHPVSRSAISGSRALSSFQLSAGGATVPDTFVQQLEMNMLWFGGMRQVAETIVTAKGEPMTWPTFDDTSNTGAQVGESDSIESEANPTFGTITWNAYKITSKMIKVPYELMEDSSVDLASIIGAALGERIGRFTNTRYTTGTGASQAYGLINRTTLGKTTAGATAITFAELLDLIHSVDVAYRPGSQFMMHDTILGYLRKQVDGNGNLIWQQSMREGEPDRIHGYGYVINNDLAAASSSAPVSASKHVVFGQLSKYKIRRVAGARLLRLDELYRGNDQTGFVAMIREDGNLLDTGTAPVKHLLQA